jgi:NADH-quinone oxidoreductase subunit C
VTPDELARVVVARVGETAAAAVTFDQVTVDVPRDGWVGAATVVRDDVDLACGYFDWLSAYQGGPDRPEELAIVLHVWSMRHRHHLLLRTWLPLSDLHLPTLTGLWRGANWHERETFEMFGVVFDGHPNLVPLLLPDGFVGRPLRKEFVLASRVAKPWPGAKEPGESDADSEAGGRHAAPSRRRNLPPGVPEDWGS